MTRTAYLSLFSLALCSTLWSEELTWQWENGKLVQRYTSTSNLTQTTPTDFDDKIEWSVIDGKVTQIDHSLKVRNPKKKMLIVDIPNSESTVLSTPRFNRSKDTTSAFEGSNIKSIQEFSDDSDSILQNLKLEDQIVSLPQRIAPSDNKNIHELNQWGENLVQTKSWIDYHSERIEKDKRVDRSFINFFKKTFDQYVLDVQAYQKALAQASSK